MLTSGNRQDAADPPADLGATIPVSPVDASAVLAQLERILASSPFRNSKRYPALLRYVVEKHLNGASSELKERTIAIDVFARDPYYDPAVDPVVRISAGEVRKRLAQYYQETAAANELRIELPVGSYHPEFIVPTPARPIPSVLPAPAVLPVADQTLALAKPRRTRGAVAALCGFVALAVLVGLSLYSFAHRPTALDLFWRPVIQQRYSVMLCLGSIGLQPANSQHAFSHPVDPHQTAVAWWDAETLPRVAGLVQSKGASPGSDSGER